MEKIKFSIENKSFVKALKTATRVINKKNPMPILADIKLELKGGALTMTAGNSEAYITQPLADYAILEGPKEWALCFNPDTLISILAEIGDHQLRIAINDDNLMQVDYTLTEDTAGNFSLPIEDAAEYPEVKRVEAIDKEQPTEFCLPGAWLLKEVQNARVSVANDDLRPMMNNICLDADQEGLNLVSSDGHTLYTTRYEWGVGNPAGPFIRSGQPRQVLLDKQILGVLADAFHSVADITIRSNGHHVELTAEGGILLTCVCCDKKFPNWRSVIPTKEVLPYEAVVEAASIVAALRRVNPFSDCNTNLVRLEFSGNRLAITAEDTDFSRSASESVLLQSNTLTDTLTIGMKASRLMQMIQVAAKTENCILQFAQPDRPILIHPEDRNDATTALVMPMLVN